MGRLIRFFLALVGLLGATTPVCAQHMLRGSFVDAKSGEVLPFVTAVYDEAGHGFTSDVAGGFRIVTAQPIRQFRATYIGYRDTTFMLTPQQLADSAVYPLAPRKLDIATVYVTAGDPAAVVLLRKALERRQLHNPASLAGYRFTSYSKLVGSLHLPKTKGESQSGEKRKIQMDIELPVEADSAGRRYYLFVNETVSRRHYERSGISVDSVLSTRTSGLQRKMLPLVANTFQSLSFYEEDLILMGEKYVNPFSTNGPLRYWYSMHDTLIAPTGDSIFSIYFWPKSNALRDDLSGYLQINRRGYALQGAVAWSRPKVEGEDGKMRYATLDAHGAISQFRIIQTYAQQGEHAWFPKELRCVITLQGIDLASESHVSGVEIIPTAKLSGRKPLASIVLPPGDASTSAHVLAQYRRVPLRDVERRAYGFVDTLSSRYKLEDGVELVTNLLDGYLAIGSARFDLLRILDYNGREGYRLGLGVETSDRASSRFRVGGYYAFGFRDRMHKYGGHLYLRILPSLDGWLEGYYTFDRHPPGTLPTGGYRTSTLRYLYVRSMDYRERFGLSIRSQVSSSINLTLGVEHGQYKNLTGYGYPSKRESAINSSQVGAHDYTLLTPHLSLHWNPNALLLRYPDGLKVLRAGPPRLSMHIMYGMHTRNMQMGFTRMELSTARVISSPIWGLLRWQSMVGAVYGNYPLAMGFVSEGVENSRFNLIAPGMLSTAEPGYFYHDYQALLNAQYTLPETAAIPITKSWRPTPCISATGLWGGQWHAYTRPNGQRLRAASKGFFELGIGLDNILPSSLPGVGNTVSIRYRLGAYQTPHWKENLSLTCTLWASFW